MTENSKFILACMNLGLELKDKNKELLTKREQQFLRALDKQSIIKTDQVYNIIFKKPYEFLGKIYYGINLSDIDNYSIEQLEKLCDGTKSYYIEITSKVINIPISFFINLPAPEAYKIQIAVRHRIKKEENDFGISVMFPLEL